jgi:hypothetical protein
VTGPEQIEAHDPLSTASAPQVQAPVAADQALLDKINVAVATANAAEKTAETAKAELVSRSRAVGELLLEAKKRYPKVADFEAFLKRVDGLKLSRAYDLMRLAGGRNTDEQLRQEARDRQRKSRAKKAKPVSVTEPHVTESPEIGVEQRKAETATLKRIPIIWKHSLHA